MKLHIFNPDHDIALSTNNIRFTAPLAAKQLTVDLDYLPALWAEENDYVLVDNINASKNAISHLRCECKKSNFITLEDLSKLDPTGLKIECWGWNTALKELLYKHNRKLEKLLPTNTQIQTIRRISNRRWTAENLLPPLTKGEDLLEGEAEYFSDKDLLYSILPSKTPCVLKAPWSSSGRGIRYVEQYEYEFNQHLNGWIKNIIKKQGGITLEPYYKKIKDFGMEFTIKSGEITYLGLSIFNTINGTYIGNSISSENYKKEILSKYIEIDLLEKIKNKIIKILSSKFNAIYEGPFGIDMMIIDNEGINKIQPCVELNLRRTMGHVALSIKPKETIKEYTMRIDHTDKYTLKILPNIQQI